MLKGFPKCAREITGIVRHSLAGNPGGGKEGGIDLQARALNES